MSRVDAFSAYLNANSKSQNTIKGYVLDINQYFKWFEESFGQECAALYRQNVLDYVSYLKNIKLYTFSQHDLDIINNHRRDHNRLGFAVQLAVLRFPGWSLSDLKIIPDSVLSYIAKQAGFP